MLLTEEPSSSFGFLQVVVRLKRIWGWLLFRFSPEGCPVLTTKEFHVLMRYTLRLLTAQQFQRASGLICAMEYLRRQDPEELGSKPFAIGIWLGASTSPNRRQQAIQALRSLNQNPKYAQNPFVLLRCPWCRAQMGPIEYSGQRPKKRARRLGLREARQICFIQVPGQDLLRVQRWLTHLRDRRRHLRRPTRAGDWNSR